MGIYTRLPVAAAICESEDETYAWRGDPSASVTLWVPWKMRYMVTSDLLGFDWDYKKNKRETVFVAGSSLPRKHPNAQNYKVTEDTSFAGMYVKSVSIKGIGASKRDGQENEYEVAELTVSYGMLPQRTKTENINYEVQSMTLPRHQFCWDDKTPLSDGEEPVRMFRTLKITHTFNFLLKIPQFFADNVGKINAEELETSQGFKLKPGTLLYEGCETSQTWTYTGSEGWSLTANYSYNPYGWNKWYNNIKEKWMTIKKIVPVKYDSGGNAIIEEYEQIDDQPTQPVPPGLKIFNMYESCTMQPLFNFDPDTYKDPASDTTGGTEGGEGGSGSGSEGGSGSGSESGGDDIIDDIYTGSNTQNTLMGADELLQWTQDLYGVGADTVNEWLRKFYQAQEEQQNSAPEDDEDDDENGDNGDNGDSNGDNNGD